VPNPELEARKEIDRQLEATGWAVQDYKDIHLGAKSHGIAVREYPLATGHVDYLLYADGRVIATVEAKPVGYPLTSVEPQSGKYVRGLPPDIPAWRNPIPFAYESTGVETQFTNGLDPEPRSRRVFTFHRPEELQRLVGQDVQLRGRLRDLPPLDNRGLWSVQEVAVTKLEESLAVNRPRALIQMATGSGKTYTAVTAAYRLIKFGGAKRILFLVDRNNLGRQTLTEFQRYVSPHNGYTFTEEFQVHRLAGNAVPQGATVVITTIQRLYSMLQGEEAFDEGNEEQSLFESGRPFVREFQPVKYNPRIPPEFFDFVIVDECHRSIYNVWRQVVEYFDAFLIGLTATPGKDTLGFFNQNLVQDYGHERAVVDGVNVGYDVYRIRTRITEGGATLPAEAGLFVPHRDRRTRALTLQELDEDLEYTASELDRDVVAEDHIRTVVRTFRDRLFTEIFPGRTNVPKTLVFAKDDSHAEDIVRVIREEFGKGNNFCQKITSKTTGVSAETLLSQFRNTYMPRIAVTVDMIATGTDVRALECLLFMRNINSASYFEQMKGRGVRIIGTDDLQSVTPDATSKSRFVIVDAVGVCERDKTTSKPLDRQPAVPLDKLLQAAATGVVHADLVSAIASRLIRLDRELEPGDRKELAGLAGGQAPATLAAGLLASLDADAVQAAAVERFSLPEGTEPTQE
jgi:type I restriction enzyme, R subunit